jgi:hypothetical protein
MGTRRRRSLVLLRCLVEWRAPLCARLLHELGWQILAAALARACSMARAAHAYCGALLNGEPSCRVQLLQMLGWQILATAQARTRSLSCSDHAYCGALSNGIP